MIYGLIFALLFFFAAKFVAGKIERKLSLVVLIMLTVLVTFISIFIIGIILFKTSGPESATGNFVSPPAAIMGIAFFWGFRSGQSDK